LIPGLEVPDHVTSIDYSWRSIKPEVLIFPEIHVILQHMQSFLVTNQWNEVHDMKSAIILFVKYYQPYYWQEKLQAPMDNSYAITRYKKRTQEFPKRNMNYLKNIQYFSHLGKQKHAMVISPEAS
jgi:hypothetical protein